jgi:hypothetical protein
MIKPRPVEHSNTLRGEGSKAGMDRRPPKLLTDAVKIFLSSGYLVLRIAYTNLKNTFLSVLFFCIDHFPFILFIIITLLVFFIILGEVNAAYTKG